MSTFIILKVAVAVKRTCRAFDVKFVVCQELGASRVFGTVSVRAYAGYLENAMKATKGRIP
jgi:tRNA G18 (ribose-2'-O)-methylase SpoU